MDIHASVARVAMLNGIVDLNSSGITAVRVGSSNLIERKWLQIQNASNVNVFVGSSTALGTAIVLDKLVRWGIKIPSGDVVWLPVNDNITVYACSQSGAGKRLRIVEYS